MQRLSSTIIQLSDAIGYAPTLRLVRAFGGRRLYVPHNLSDDTHPIALTVGSTASRHLTERWGGDYLHVPDEQTALLDLRNRHVVAEYIRGAAVRHLSRTYGVSPAMIRKILDAAGARLTPQTEDDDL